MNVNRGTLGDQHNASGNAFPPAFPSQSSHDTGFFNGLDANSSKQLAALNAFAAANARRAQSASVGPTSADFLGGINPSQQPLRPDQFQSLPPSANVHQPSLPPSANVHQPSLPSAGFPLPVPQQNMQTSMSPQANQFAQRQQITPQQAALINKNRRTQFYQGLSRVMGTRNMPLPSFITGVDSAFDPATSPWKDLEPASEPGGVKLAGKDVDLYRLWGLVFSAGGAGKVHQHGAWATIAAHFDLPQQLPHSQEHGSTSTAVALAQLYMKLLGAFEEFYYRALPDTQRQVLAQQGRLPSSFHGHNTSPPGSSGVLAQNHVPAGADPSGNPLTAGSISADNEHDAEARKRKMDEGVVNSEENNGKRRKTDPESSSEPSQNPSESVSHSQMSAPPTSAARVKARRKIEYVPLAREIETAGGRDTAAIQNELQRLSRGQHLRDINDWGKVHVDALTMSIRSRLSLELSYGLTTLIILSTMRSQGHDTGFLITQCGELLDEILDLLEDLSFPNGPDGDIHSDNDEVITNRQLVGLAHDEASTPFASEKKQGEYDSTIHGPMQRRGDLIRLILNILRNLSAVTDNQPFMAQHPVLVDLILRLTPIRIRNGDAPAAVSDALTVPDLLAVRKDVLNILVNLGGAVTLSPNPSHSQATPSKACLDRRVRLIFDLISSYLIDPVEAVGPFQWVLQSGIPVTPSVRAPLLPDAALEVFTRVSQPDGNRKVISRVVSHQLQWSLFEALVHRLPTSDNDYKLVLSRDESWMSYLEKLVLSLYSLAFLMPPELKKRVKEDRALSFAKVMLRFVKRLMSGGPQQAEMRMHFAFCARRAVETMKVIDDCEYSFDTAQPSVAPLSFGVGYGEAADTRVERGDGLLGGHEDEILWSVMLQREIDDVMFSELESLARVEKDIRVH